MGGGLPGGNPRRRWRVASIAFYSMRVYACGITFASSAVVRVYVYIRRLVLFRRGWYVQHILDAASVIRARNINVASRERLCAVDNATAKQPLSLAQSLPSSNLRASLKPDHATPWCLTRVISLISSLSSFSFNRFVRIFSRTSFEGRRNGDRWNF